MNRTFTPKCPYCEYEFDEEEMWYSDYNKTGEVYTGDGDDSELKCPNLDCGKEFKVVCIHEVKFEVSEE